MRYTNLLLLTYLLSRTVTASAGFPT